MTEERARAATLHVAVRGAIGGTLMGLANLVPGISGATMLLVAGGYPGVIGAIAELTTFRFRTPSLLLLGSVAGTAGLGILLLAGTVKGLVQDHRWVMYSLFIGLTLGGVPIVWRMARPASASLVAGGLAAFALMLAMTFLRAGPAGLPEQSAPLVFASGVAASSAMILPGISGGYLFLLLGQYEAILGTIDQLKRGLLGEGLSGAPEWALVADAMDVVIPLGLGIVVGVVGVSNLLQWLLRRFAKPTLGVLLGLLLGAVVGLWPFQQARPPEPGDLIAGRQVTAQNAASFEPEDWPVRFFEPSAVQFATAAGMIALGLAATLLIARLGGGANEAAAGGASPAYGTRRP